MPPCLSHAPTPGQFWTRGGQRIPLCILSHRTSRGGGLTQTLNCKCPRTTSTYQPPAPSQCHVWPSVEGHLVGKKKKNHFTLRSLQKQVATPLKKGCVAARTREERERAEGEGVMRRGWSIRGVRQDRGGGKGGGQRTVLNVVTEKGE